MEARCGCPSPPIAGRPPAPIIGHPQLRLHHGHPLLGCHFVGVRAHPLLDTHLRPFIGRPRLSIMGTQYWASVVDADGPTRTGRPRHLSTRRPSGQVQANRINVRVRSPITIKCPFTSYGSNFFLIKNFFVKCCKSKLCAFPLHRSLSLRRQLNNEGNGVH